MKSGHKIIEEALIEAVSEKQNFPFGMSQEQGSAYKKGLAAAYQHTLEMIPDMQSRLEELNQKVTALQQENASLKKSATRLHGEIMNIPAKCAVLSHDETAYKEGHRDARHAAAELVVVMKANAQ